MRTTALLLSATVAIGLASTQANAASTTLSFSSVCDVAQIASQRSLANVWSYLETKRNGSCDNVMGEGTLGQATLNGIDSQWISFGLFNTEAPDEQDMLVVQYPLVTGNAFLFYETKNGKKVSLSLQGTYTVGSGADKSAQSSQDFRHSH